MQAVALNPMKLQALSPDLRTSVERTQRFLRHTFRKNLAEPCQAEVSEQSLYIEDPHIYATWSTQSCLLGAGFKIGVRIQFDSDDGRLLQEMMALHHQETLPTFTDTYVVRRMQDATDAIAASLQRHCQGAGLITGISQACVTKAFSKTQTAAFQLRGGAIDSWLLRIKDCVLYCTTQVIFDESRDIVVLGQSLPT